MSRSTGRCFARFRILLALLVMFGFCDAVGLRAACRAAVIGVFDSARAGQANLVDGLYTSQARASLQANFPDATIATTTTLTPEFLAGVDVILIASPAGSSGGITPLSPEEQFAVFEFVANGGGAMMLSDYYTGSSSAQSLVAPFGVLGVDDGLSGLQPGTIQEPSHPIFDGPFGIQSNIAVLGAGMFVSLGPLAHSLAVMNSTGQPIVAAIEANTIAPGSGRVLLFSDATLFADPVGEGFFSQTETLFLNSIHYLVPEPATNNLAFAGLLVLGVIRCRSLHRRSTGG